jgi:hypothetical protein
MKHRGQSHRYGRDGCQEPLLYVEIIEASLLDTLEEISLEAEVYDGLIKKIDLMRQTDDTERSDRALLKVLNHKLQRITELYIEGDSEKTTYKSRRAVVEAEIVKLQATTSVRTPADLRSLTDEVIGQLKQPPNGSPQAKKSVIHNLVKRLEISQRKTVRLVPTPQAAPFFTNLMDVDVGVTLARGLNEHNTS